MRLLEGVQKAKLCKDSSGSHAWVFPLLLRYSHLSGDFGGPDALIHESFMDILQGRKEEAESLELCVPASPTNSR